MRTVFPSYYILDLDISIDRYLASSDAARSLRIEDAGSAAHNSTAYFFHDRANLFLTCRPSRRIKTGPAGPRTVRVNPFRAIRIKRVLVATILLSRNEIPCLAYQISRSSLT